MSILPILKYPDVRLRTVASPVKQINQEILTLASDMLETMHHANGIGLAATQVNVHIQMLVAEETREKSQPHIMLNPKIVWKSEEQTFESEGCLSLPGCYAEVPRFSSIRVNYLNLQGNEQTVLADGLFAIVIQHEMDHLKGIVFADYLSRPKRNIIKNKLLNEQKSHSVEA